MTHRCNITFPTQPTNPPRIHINCSCGATCQLWVETGPRHTELDVAFDLAREHLTNPNP